MLFSNTFLVQLPKSTSEYLQQTFPFLFETVTESSTESDTILTLDCSVTSANAIQWLEGFDTLFAALQDLFPSDRKEPPDSGNVEGGVLIVQCLIRFKPIIKFLLSFPASRHALENVGTFYFFLH